jgi:hypothetical protein
MAHPETTKDSVIDDSVALPNAPHVELDVDGVVPTGIKEWLREKRSADEHACRFAQEIRACSSASSRERTAACHSRTVWLGQMAKAPCTDDHFVVVVDDPATATGKGRRRVPPKQPYLNGQAFWNEQVIVTDNLDELALRTRESTRPVVVKTEPLGGVGQEPHTWVIERSGDLGGPVCGGVVRDHDFKVLIRLVEHRGHARLNMTFTVKDGDHYGDQRLRTQRHPDRRSSRAHSLAGKDL